jgi:hypothetical protein
MATVTREAVMNALVSVLTVLKTAAAIPTVDAATGQTITPALPPLKFVARRVRDPENVESNERPCLYLVEHLDTYEQDSIDIPSIRGMVVRALLYVDVSSVASATAGQPPGVGVIPMTQVNYYIEAMETALSPDGPGGFVLGEMVRSCWIVGTGIRASGDTTGKMLAAIPIVIELP